MAIWDLIPTCNDEMSVYSLIGFCLLFSVCVSSYMILFKWIRSEIVTMKRSIDSHDAYIDETAKVFNEIQIQLAVQESSMKTLESDITEIKADVKTLLSRNNHG